jgi:hypothetical protein
MAPLVSSAIFAPYEPDQQAARQAWVLESQARRALRRDAGWLVRVRAAVDPRPLLPPSRAAASLQSEIVDDDADHTPVR